jgi:hypothetical protein
MLTVLHRCYLYLRRCRRCPPFDPGRTTFERPRDLKANRSPTIPSDQVIRAAPAWSFPLDPRYSQFLPLFHDWPPMRPSKLCYSHSRPRNCSILCLSFGSRAPQCSVPTCRSHWRLLVYRCAYRDCIDPSCVRMGCMGHVDASGSLVCVVAGLVDWMRPIGILYVLIIFYIFPIL